jgi:SanA protein
LLLAALILAGMAVGGGIHLWIEQTATNQIHTIADAPPRRVALVFGARVYPDGRVSRPMAIRLAAARKLYENGTVERILVSGDHGRASYNEPETMRTWLIERGVDPTHVRCDYAGFRTLDTVARARRVWGLEELILVTQRYHLPRALFLARHFGLQPVGVSADGLGGSAPPAQRMREFAAQILAWLDVTILGTEPRYEGDPEEI